MAKISFRLPGPQDRGYLWSWPRKVEGACRRVLKQGEARNYSDAHLVARWCIGLLSPMPVACRACGVTDFERDLHAALDWEQAPADRLRIDYRRRVFSTRPDLDYIPLCVPCHRRHDSWHKALPAGIQAA